MASERPPHFPSLTKHSRPAQPSAFERRILLLSLLAGTPGGVVALTLLWIAGAAALVGLAPLAKRLAYGEQGAGVLVLAGAKWLVWDGLRPALERWHRPVVTVWPVLNLAALAGVLLVVLLVLGRRWVRRERW